MINYRSFANFESCVAKNFHKIPRDIDLIVGIPRSGLLVATMISLHLNRPLTDVEGLMKGRILTGGKRLEHLNQDNVIKKARQILIVDDSVASGYEMRRVRKQLQSSDIKHNLIFLAVYVTEDSLKEVDIYFEICPMPRVFAWNLMHNSFLEYACVDIDGVLCRDPSENENDDGPKYLEFIKNVAPLIIPTVKVGTLVTCRLEKYRQETEEWLKKHGVQYKELVMWNLRSKKERLASGNHGEFKASIFRSRTWAEFFIESSKHQAQIIAVHSRKPVICVETQQVCLPSMSELVTGALRKTPRVLCNRINRYISWLHRPLKILNYV